jgi:hypothetical protein
VYDVQPSVSVTETGVDGRIEAISIKESGSFYKIVRTGGIRWYEFDVEDAQENPLITIGNCPCSYDVCTDKSDCNGCASKNAYPSGHNKLNSSPFNPAEAITAKEIRSYFGEPWYKPFNPEDDPPDAEGCITDDSVKGDSGGQSDQLIPLYCPPDSNQTGYCNESCDGRIPCDKNCTCSDEDCVCTKQQTYAFGLTFISGWFPRNDYDYCWPLNNTWEFPNFTENYGLSACSGDPVVSGFRPYLDGDTIIPHKRPQYEYVWQPNTTAFTESIESIIELNPLENKGKAYVNFIKDEYLSIEGCNPLRVDRFGKSYKFIDPTGERTYPTNPCRKTNSGDPIPSGAIRTSDDYCRVYGFYQQRQPDCEILYRGQYIMRAAEKYGFGQNPNYPAFSCPSPDNPYPLYVEGHTWTDCEPIIGDINIRLKQIESQFDISVGAPYSQDYLIPENLPLPYVGPDGKYESTADAWNEPSLSKTNNTRFFDHGFYEPNRYAKYEDKQLPENESEEIGEREQILSPVFLVNPVFNMPDVDGGDYPTTFEDALVDLYNPGVWDLPDPRSNCRPGVSGISCEDECDNPTYGPNVNLPATGTRNDLRSECPYPWERWGNDQSNTNDIDYYCMLKNNSAEIVIDEIVECEDCFSNDIVRIDYIQNLNNTQYPALFWYSYAIEVPSEEEPAPEPTPAPSSSSPGTSAPADDQDQTTPGPRYILFRLYGNFGEINDLSVIEAFHNLINQYISILGDRYQLSDILSILLNDTHRSILWNMVFQGADTDYQLAGLTKVEIFAFESVSAEFS